MEHEKSFVEAFIILSKRERVLEALSCPKKRTKFLKQLPHFNDFEIKNVSSISPAEQNAKSIHNILVQKGAPKVCYIISLHNELDQQLKDLQQSLDTVVGNLAGTIISCIPGKLAYYEGEHRGERYLLEKRIK